MVGEHTLQQEHPSQLVAHLHDEQEQLLPMFVVGISLFTRCPLSIVCGCVLEFMFEACVCVALKKKEGGTR
jgi:hypothetical protein